MKLVYEEGNLVQAVVDGKDLEFFDILDENGNKTGKIKERSLVHEDGDIHGTVHIWIRRKTEKGYDLLLQKRSKEKDSFPGCYDISSAGHISAGDEPLETALRELEEELGIKAEPEQLKKVCMHEGSMNGTSMEENLRIMRSARFICMKKQWILQNLNYRKKKSKRLCGWIKKN